MENLSVQPERVFKWRPPHRDRASLPILRARAAVTAATASRNEIKAICTYQKVPTLAIASFRLQ
jgi:hypothetical protein